MSFSCQPLGGEFCSMKFCLFECYDIQAIGAQGPRGRGREHCKESFFAPGVDAIHPQLSLRTHKPYTVLAAAVVEEVAAVELDQDW